MLNVRCLRIHYRRRGLFGKLLITIFSFAMIGPSILIPGDIDGNMARYD